MGHLLTETASYDEPGSWGRMSVGYPEVRGDVARQLYVFCNMTGVIPYGSYVLMSERGKYGANESCIRVHVEHLQALQQAFEAAGRPTAEESIRRKRGSGKPYAPHWWKDAQ